MNTTTMTGKTGEVRWGYHPAASVGSWSISVDATGGTLSAALVSSDAYRLTQPALTFVAPIRNGTASWKWPITALQLAGGTLTASLGPQE